MGAFTFDWWPCWVRTRGRSGSAIWPYYGHGLGRKAATRIMLVPPTAGIGRRIRELEPVAAGRAVHELRLSEQEHGADRALMRDTQLFPLLDVTPPLPVRDPDRLQDRLDADGPDKRPCYFAAALRILRGARSFRWLPRAEPIWKARALEPGSRCRMATFAGE